MDVPLRGLTKDEAVKKLRWQAVRIPDKLYLQYGGNRYVLDIKKANFSYQVEKIADQLFSGKKGSPPALLYTFDENYVEQRLLEIAALIDQSPVNARLVKEKGSYRAVEGKNGLRMDIGRAMASIRESFSAYHLKQPIDLVVREVTPAVNASQIKHMKQLLGQSVTYFRSDKENRVHNLQRAANAVNGILQPDEVFSFQKRVGPFSEKNGYREANVLINAEIEQGIGGGVCQVSSTLYHAGLLSMMEITEHHPHSVPVNYIPIGLDATVDNNHLNLSFRNPLSRPVYIQSEVDGGALRISFFTDDATLRKNVKIVTGDVEILPREIILKSTTEAELGQPKWTQRGRDGYRIKVWRILAKDGLQVDRELITVSTYPKVDDIIIHHPLENKEVLEEWKKKVQQEQRKDSAAELG